MWWYQYGDYMAGISTTVGDHVGIPAAVRFVRCLSSLLLVYNFLLLQCLGSGSEFEVDNQSVYSFIDKNR
jgi:hypothetical protein